jgi:hypothetical protein
MDNNSNYTLLGNFDLKDAKIICELIEVNNIDFELEIDDSAIRDMSAFQAAYGGTFGSGATANIYVQTHSSEQCKKIIGGILN